MKIGQAIRKNFEGGCGEAPVGQKDEGGFIGSDRLSMEKRLQIGYQYGTKFGGVLTLFGFLAVSAILVQQSMGIWYTKKHDFSSESIYIDDQELGELETDLNSDHAFKFVFGSYVGPIL